MLIGPVLSVSKQGSVASAHRDPIQDCGPHAHQHIVLNSGCMDDCSMPCTINRPRFKERSGPNDTVKRSLQINHALRIAIVASLDGCTPQSQTYGDVVADECWSRPPLRIVPGHVHCHAILDVGVVPDNNIVHVTCAGQCMASVHLIKMLTCASVSLCVGAAELWPIR